jgi:hypothetical protein
LGLIHQTHEVGARSEVAVEQADDIEADRDVQHVPKDGRVLFGMEM